MKLTYRDLKETTNLFRDFIYNFEKVDTFYAGNFRKIESFEKCRADLTKRKYFRNEIASILERQNSELGASVQTLKNISYLKDNHASVVFTGQQVGILGGPLFTIYKAISDIKLAGWLSEKLKTKVIPLFWLAADDHDFLEVNHIYLLNPQSQVTKIEYKPRTDWQGKPMAKVILEESINSFSKAVGENLAETKYKNEVLDKLFQFYQEGQFLSLAFARWLTFLLGKYGLVIVNPADKDLKKLAAPIFEQEIEQNGRLENIFRETNLKLEQRDYHQQIKKKENYLNIFVDNGQRSTVRKEKDFFVVEATQEKFTSQQLRGLLNQKPNLFSPNVILRPMIQSYLFPTLAYVGGPSEVAYFAQLKELYKALEINMPVIYPRATVALLERKTLEMLERYSLDIRDILTQDIESVINQVLEKTLPPNWEENFTKTQAEIKSKFEDLESEVAKLEPTLKETFATTKGKVDFELNKLKEKYFQAHKRKNKIVREQLYKVKNHLYPENDLQERKFNLVYYLNKYGFDLIDFLFQSIEVDDFEPKVLILEEEL
ncbi:MAG: hypothetical protein RBG1_1C00001G1766 [candidate division Zixibacteria bacterium RBG-1]|nr:MAG: hypothetical protein RBG1_1C00001G1766 [candidate division Zixibacteria bacterium RBG-1]OGC85367.1 MAG: bacillithiol biosynthesis cysteine-adding enzyme BshC [candidate division Zixibacteria bacterium RBG_19FT_COMBO_42_43]